MHSKLVTLAAIATTALPLSVVLPILPRPATLHAQTLYRTDPSVAIDYFLEVALGSEFGNNDPQIKKWVEPLRIKVHGSPTPEDRRILRTVMQELNALTNIDWRFDSTNPNVDIYFVPESEFHQYEPNYVPVSYGFFWTWWKNYEISQARILISTTEINQRERAHIIREELTQSLGLMRDSYRFSDSIFFQGWTDVTEYSELDKAVISLLYRPEVRPGMSKEELLDVLRTSSR
ncbi:DUF2927 domain-containing protein [Phormidium sp. CCY1219]|uniref:DUF2927 domain-containing protein n=1 Tax=Phormidium sp. CCY1219 TaxID=2886104 RepID=UPI002D1EC3AC|nr:DUF2927 domain-containing protein [Phormidium sp. CCY1219]MEB3830929.1 DUF2927 domain-containing protein [Phormidium sp. CCY1219]